MKVVEEVSYVFPPAGSVPTTSLPLTFFDRVFLVSLPPYWMRRLFFYDFKYPTLHFMQTILPDLKTSLSLTLQHFFPLAGNLVFPSPPQKMPYVLYKEGDSVSFVVKESSADFNYLVGDHARDYREFQPLLPNMPPATVSMSSSNDCKQEPVMAIQVTVFPDMGFSIGVGFSHVVVDGRTLAHFMKSWASIHRCQGDFTLLDHNYLPCCFDRDLINVPLELASLFARGVERTLQGPVPPRIMFNNFRVNYKIKGSEVELLKDWVKRKSMDVNGSEAIRISTFGVTCAYLWVCLIKLQQTGTHDDQHLDSDALCYFRFSADCRDHLKLPETYFGNCIIPCLAEAKKSEILGENGIVVAATAIGRETTEFKKQTFEATLEALPKIVEKSKMGKDVIWAVSSPKFDVYKTDFGSGRPRKTEVGMLASYGTKHMFCIAERREEEGGVEFALAFASHDLDTFNAIFQEGLLKLQ